jgi:hypothetical protein
MQNGFPGEGESFLISLKQRTFIHCSSIHFSPDRPYTEIENGGTENAIESVRKKAGWMAIDSTQAKARLPTSEQPAKKDL